MFLDTYTFWKPVVYVRSTYGFTWHGNYFLYDLFNCNVATSLLRTQKRYKVKGTIKIIKEVG